MAGPKVVQKVFPWAARSALLKADCSAAYSAVLTAAAVAAGVSVTVTATNSAGVDISETQTKPEWDVVAPPVPVADALNLTIA